MAVSYVDIIKRQIMSVWHDLFFRWQISSEVKVFNKSNYKIFIVENKIHMLYTT